MALIDGQGRNVPFFIDWFEYHYIAIKDFSPSEDPSMTDVEIGKWMDKGFLVRPNADGLLYGITLHAYLENNKSLTGLVPEAFLAKDGQWIECRFVKVFASNTTLYPTVATFINAGVTV